MRKETTARAAGGIGLSHTEVCAVSEFILVNRGKMDFLVYASEYSTECGVNTTEWYLALMAPKPIFFFCSRKHFETTRFC